MVIKENRGFKSIFIHVSEPFRKKNKKKIYKSEAISQRFGSHSYSVEVKIIFLSLHL